MSRFHQIEAEELSIGMKSTLSHAQRELLMLASNLRGVVDPDLRNRQLNLPYHKHYLSILHDRYYLLRPLLQCHYQNQDGEASDNEVPGIYFEAFKTIVEQLSDGNNGQPCTLRSIIDSLTHVGFLKPSLDQCSDLTDATAGQLVFIMIGWVTLMYAPSLPAQQDQLSRSRLDQLVLREEQDENGADLNSDSTTPCSVSFKEASHLTLSTVLKTFGRLIPMYEPPPFQQWAPQVEINPPADRILVSYVNYHHLRKLSDVRVVFISSWSQHLDFNEYTRTIKIFKYPSACAVFCSGKRGPCATFMASLFSQYFRNHDEDNEGFSSMQDSPIDGLHFFRELLLTYRVIFGQDRASSELFREEHKNILLPSPSPSLSCQWSWTNPPLTKLLHPWRRWATQKAAFEATEHKGSELVDPLLLQLCGTDCKKASIYRDIRVPVPRDQYLTAKDFPFFGERLSKIQVFMQGEHPNDWKALRNDRRDMIRYWTFWMVVIIGGASIILSVIQNILAIIQIIAQYQGAN